MPWQASSFKALENDIIKPTRPNTNACNYSSSLLLEDFFLNQLWASMQLVRERTLPFNFPIKQVILKQVPKPFPIICKEGHLL
jgi:hypothetical protein